MRQMRPWAWQWASQRVWQRTCRRRWQRFRVALLVVLTAAPAVLAQPPDNLRILSYNTAFMWIQAEAVAPVGPPCVTSCDPFEPPAPLPCTCSSIAISLNRFAFADVEEKTRAEKIAERILATDQDVVVLNEVFDPAAREVFATLLGDQGPYKHYVSLLRGRAPVQFSSLEDLEGPQGSQFLTEIPTFMLPYQPVNNDSGLMLFSRYELLPIHGSWTPNDALCGAPDCGFEGRNGGQPLAADQVVFKVFDECGGLDCLASKGVGLVKIDSPRGPSFVAFTHLQADEEGDFWSARRSQYEEIRRVLTGAIAANALDGAFVYVAGDLNTYGSTRDEPPHGEWHELFDPESAGPNAAQGFFACGNGVAGNPSRPCRSGVDGRYLTDGWGFETSLEDRGNDGSRLDYVLHSPFSGRLCTQHMQYAWDLQADAHDDGGLMWLSDHFPVRADFGLTGRWCSANDDPEAAGPGKNVHDLTFGTTDCTGSSCDQDEVIGPPRATLGPAGAFQWFRIQQAGSYSIDIAHAPGAAVAFDVYHESDLSRPIIPFDKDETRWGTLYSFPFPPYYIRTFAVDSGGAPDRTARGRDYTLKVHQHLCRHAADACALEPGLARSAPYSYRWPTTVHGNPLTELRSLYWRFKTSGVKDGRLRAGTQVAFPRVAMQIEAAGGESYTCITAEPPVIEEWNDGMAPSQLVRTIPFSRVEVDDDRDWEDDGLQDDFRVAPDLPGKVDDEAAIYFLKLTRDSGFQDAFNVCNPSLTSFVSFHTDLTFLAPRKVQMYAELDDDLGAADDMRFHVGYDAGGYRSNPPAASSADLVLDEPDHASLYGYERLRGYYVSAAWPTFWERDEEEHLQAWAPYEPFTGLPTLSSWSRSNGNGLLQLSDGGNPDSADYYYLLYYTACRHENVTACANPNVAP